MSDTDAPEKAQPADTLAVPGPGRFIAELIKAADWRWLPLPLLLLAAEFALLHLVPFVQWRLKDAFEFLAIVVLAAAVALGILRAAVQQKAFFVWVTVLVAALLFREFHLFKISTTIVYVVVFALWIIAWRMYPHMHQYLRNRRVMTPIMLTGACYVITQTLDIDTFKYGSDVFPVLEEMMEVTGHVFALLLVILARPRTVPA
jgi:hypothetical protein